MRGTPAQVAAEIGRRAAALKPALRDAERLTLLDIQAEAKRLSRGVYKTETLAKMGHPYAKRKPRPPADAGIINLQKGDLLRGWRRKTGNWSGGTLFSSVFNISAHGALVEAMGKPGSPTIARPLPLLIPPLVRRARLARLRAVLRKVL
jgi:hypothetical protein